MTKKMIQKKQLESLYAKYNHREYVHPDPIEFYTGTKDWKIGK